MLAAYYYPATKAMLAKGRQHELRLERLENGRSEHVATFHPCDRREARRMALANAATPWNF